MPIKSPHDKYKESFQSGLENEQDLDNSQDNLDFETLKTENDADLKQDQNCNDCTTKADIDEDKLRAMAEMENYKKRLSREHSEQLKYATESVLASLLPTLDNLDLAVQYGSKHEACQDMLTGVKMTQKLLLDAVKAHGLVSVGEVGEDYTPELHEALTFEIRDDMEEGKVSKVMQRGYKLKDRLIRPAKISISKLS